MKISLFWNTIKQWAKRLKNQLYIVYLAYKHRDTPLYAKAFAFLVIAYAFSPIDFIPDFIPILGYVDDVILVPFGIYISFRIIPSSVLAECRRFAEQHPPGRKPRFWVSAVVMIIAWIAIAVWLFQIGASLI